MHGHESPVHGLIACGGEDGFVECFDLRQKASVGRVLAVGAGNEDQVRDQPTLYTIGITCWDISCCVYVLRISI